MAEVVCLGILVADIWARPVDWRPIRGQLSLLEGTGIGVGGCAANTAVSLARLDVKTAVMGCVGQDGFGDLVIDLLRRDGLEVHGIRRTQAAGTSTTLIMIDQTGESTYLHCIGANGQLTPGSLDMETIRSSRVLHLAGVQLMPGFDGEPEAQVLAAAQAAGVITSVDTAWNERADSMALLGPLLPHIDIFVPNLAEARRFTGQERPEDAAQALLDAGVKLVGLKMGAEGSYVRTVDTELRVPAYPVEVLDTSGSGDAFIAGFLYGNLRGWDLERTTRFANAIGGLACTAAGTTGGFSGYDQVINFLEEHEPGRWGDLVSSAPMA